MAANDDIAATPPGRLAEIGASISRLFDSLKHIDHKQLQVDSGDSTTLEHEAERFELWAVNIGLHHFGHSSLDYRLREVDLLHDAFKALLIDLKKSLMQISDTDASGNLPPAMVTRTYRPGSNPGDLVKAGLIESEQQDLLDDYGSDSGEDQGTDYALLLRDVSDIIDRLYKISTKIRTSSNRLRSSKVLQYHNIDEETQVDLIGKFRQLDELHVGELLHHYQGSEKIGAEQFLKARLSAANTRRRQQFGHWKQHHQKMTQTSLREKQNATYIQTSATRLPSQPNNTPKQSNPIIEPQAVVGPSVTTATHLTATRIRLDDQSSVISISTWAGSETGIDEAQEFPEPPKTFAGLKYFQCPYCYTLCSSSHLEKRAWRSHLLHDLRPYICTYKHFELGHVMFDRRQDWVEHESSAHRKSWRCLQHTEQNFANISAYRDHLSENHGDDANTQLEELLRAGETIASTPDRPCPFCFATFDNIGRMERHVAKHLERIARFALPRSTGLEDDKDDVRNSGGQVEGSQASCSGLPAFSNESSTGDEFREPAHVSARILPVSSDAIQHYQGAVELSNQSRVYEFITSLQQSPTQRKEGVTVMAAESRPGKKSLSDEREPNLVVDPERRVQEEATARKQGYSRREASTNITEVPNRDSPDDIWIAVMGPRGVGKSSLINLVTTDAFTLSGGLKSAKLSSSPNTQVSELVHRDRRMQLIEIPDFTSALENGQEVLHKCAQWLMERYKANVILSGVLYLHRINDARMSTAALRYLDVFVRLCGKDNFKSVVIVSTGWEALDQTTGSRREKEWMNTSQFWGNLIERGSVVQRHDGSQVSALRILSNFLNREERFILQIQREMDMGMAFEDTAAASFLLSNAPPKQTKEEEESGIVEEEGGPVEEPQHKESVESYSDPNPRREGERDPGREEPLQSRPQQPAGVAFQSPERRRELKDLGQKLARALGQGVNSIERWTARGPWPVRDVLSKAGEQKLNFEVPAVTRRDRLLIAVELASNVLQLREDRLRLGWTLNDVAFPKFEEVVSAESGSSPILELGVPYFTWSLTEEPRLASTTSPELIIYPAVFYLGIALVELALWEPLLENRNQFGNNDPDQRIKILVKATHLLPDVSEELGPRYAEVVKLCMSWPSSRPRDPDLEKEAFEKAVYQHVISPLESELKLFGGKEAQFDGEQGSGSSL